MTDLKVGDRIPDPAAMDALPVGAAVTTTGGRKLVTKHPDGWAQHRDMTDRYPAAHYWYEGIEIVSLPTSYYNGPMTGDVITSVEQINALPNGTVLAQQSNPANRYDSPFPDRGAHAYRWRGVYAGGEYTDEQMWGRQCSKSPYVVESLPVDLFETVEQFAWRFRDLAITGEERALSTATSSVRMLEKMEVPFRPSVGLRITSQHDRNLLAQSTEPVRVYVGNPEKPDTFALWERRDGRWKCLLGNEKSGPDTAVAVTVDAIGDKTEPDEWLVQEPTPDDIAAVRVLRAKAWKLGWEEKVSRSWCSEYERVMLRAGLTEETAKLPLPGNVKSGDVLTVEQARMQYVGSTFKVEDDEGLVALFVRSDEAKNKAGTKRVWASDRWKGGHYADSMVLLNGLDMPGTALLTQVGSLTGKRGNRELAEMPVGTQIRHPSNTAIYQKVEATGRSWGEAGRVGGVLLERDQIPRTYDENAFTSQYTYIRIGDGK